MRRLEWIIGGLLAIFLILGLGVAAIVFISPPLIEEESPAEITALSAYNLALPIVRQWSADAALVNARATWQDGADFSLGQASWGFVFYSPSQASTLLVAVTNGQATRLNSRPIDQVPPLVSAGDWNIDSETAVRLLLNNGGSGFVNTHSGATFNLILNATQGQPVWEGAFIAQETGRTLHVRLDAGSGDVLDIQQSE